MIHRFSLFEKYIVLDVNSGAVLLVDEMTYDLVGRLELLETLPDTFPESMCVDLPQYSVDLLREAYGEVYSLYDEGFLFSADDYIEERHLTASSGAPIKALCLHVSHDCNLRCEYCFASKGDFGTGRRQNMSPETAKRAIDFVVNASGSRRNIEIDFFGGEPLLAMDTVKEAVAYAKQFAEKNFRFTITTNGLALTDEYIDYINREMDNVVLSLDGRPEVNDRYRKTAGGQGSYKHIVPKFQTFVERRKETGKDYYVRGTFTKQNLDFTEDVLHLAALGFDQISVEPVVVESVNKDTSMRDYANDAQIGIDESDLETVYREYERLAEKMLHGVDFRFFHFNVDLSQGPCLIKRIKGCGAGTEYVAITPDGEIYPCHQFVGREEYRMGSLDEGISAPEVRAEFEKIHALSRDECRRCWARFYCSGGCSAANLTANGTLDIPYEIGCKLEKKRLECALVLAAIRQGG
ncbi:thioether cross-link-forming SCIFF peptide maturase [Oscillospiraceae bacterium OttesenSCG-928-G22]|nr:thioether cross-link-forming SCIFF peptide maturase [Oscillospiraceae bacterium OttesenSCG-928-G22]